MSERNVTPINEANEFGADEIIVSKTDLKGYVTYANDVFCRVAEVSTAEALGKPHSFIRHPDMPRCVFKLLWETLEAGEEIFAYVKNMAVSGRYYWVLAHVTPTRDQAGNIIGFHSSRRHPKASAISKIEPIYKKLVEIENGHASRKDGMAASFAFLVQTLNDLGVTYDQFVWSLGE